MATAATSARTVATTPIWNVETTAMLNHHSDGDYPVNVDHRGDREDRCATS